MHYLGFISSIVQIWKKFPATLHLLFRRGTKWQARAVIIVALVYLFLPFDIIPDWILGLGIVDDIVMVTMLFGLAHRLAEGTTSDN